MPESNSATTPARPVDLSNYKGFRTKESLWNSIEAALANGRHSAHHAELTRQFNCTRFYLLNDNFQVA